MFNLVGEATVSTISVSSSDCFCHQRSLSFLVKRNIYIFTRNVLLLSLPLAQLCADVSQLHSKSITETFAEIMIKTLASCHSDLIRDILASLFFLRYRLSKLHTTERSAFVQTADITCRQRANRFKNSQSILSRSTSTFVLFVALSKPSSANEPSPHSSFISVMMSFSFSIQGFPSVKYQNS